MKLDMQRPGFHPPCFQEASQYNCLFHELSGRNCEFKLHLGVILASAQLPLKTEINNWTCNEQVTSTVSSLVESARTAQYLL